MVRRMADRVEDSVHGVWHGAQCSKSPRTANHVARGMVDHYTIFFLNVDCVAYRHTVYMIGVSNLFLLFWPCPWNSLAF